MSNNNLQKLSLRIAIVALLALSPTLSWARDAAFVDPGMGGNADSNDAIKVEPKNDIDAGETIVGVARRTNLFFVNQTTLPIKIQKLSVNGDSNVTPEITNDDCSKQQTIPPQSRCNLEVSITPLSPGAWGVDVLMTHDGPGRIVRAKITGKTSGSVSNDDRKQLGLSLSAKESSPINFGDVEVGYGKAVRTALMINDSTDPISVLAIDVIEADNGLHRLEQGCAVDMELKPGESCPVTLVWMPSSHGEISTDLIIRHTGKLGFAVIPVRGNAKGADMKGSYSSMDKNYSRDRDSSLPPPPSARDLESTAGKIASSALNGGLSFSDKNLMLIGTVGTRAIILKPDNSTSIVGVGESFNMGREVITVSAVGANSAALTRDGHKILLSLTPSQELMARASEQKRTEANYSASTMNSAANNSPSPSPAPSTTPGTPSGGAR